MKHDFKKEERLKKRNAIKALFEEGSSFAAYPLRIVWLETPLETPFPIQIAFTVPKRKYKKAVQRNRLKRQMREAFRLNKYKLYEALEGHDQKYAIMLIYTGQRALPYSTIEVAINKIIPRFVKKLQKQANKHS